MSWGLGVRKPPVSAETFQVLMSVFYRDGWRCSFFMNDRRRTALPRSAFIRTDEELIEFIQRGRGIQGSDDRYHVEAIIRRRSGDILLRLTAEQYQALRSPKKARG